MKAKSLLSSLAVAGGLFLATLDVAGASACPFAKNKGVLGANLLDFSKVALSVGVITAALGTAGAITSRARQAGKPDTGEEMAIPSAFPIIVPPDALASSVEEAETTRLY
ncbi:hypothetical protein V0288_02185 [Pannus brasiliensis CCIBt3594]|uniref:Uncharacterized protein n=1 Tax=Pannus brasiliensis CCIBt3594 TaxID=1427578 RepID=A0AAW9QDS8_9CHRO